MDDFTRIAQILEIVSSVVIMIAAILLLKYVKEDGSCDE